MPLDQRAPRQLALGLAISGVLVCAITITVVFDDGRHVILRPLSSYVAVGVIIGACLLGIAARLGLGHPVWRRVAMAGSTILAVGAIVVGLIVFVVRAPFRPNHSAVIASSDRYQVVAYYYGNALIEDRVELFIRSRAGWASVESADMLACFTQELEVSPKRHLVTARFKNTTEVEFTTKDGSTTSVTFDSETFEPLRLIRLCQNTYSDLT